MIETNHSFSTAPVTAYSEILIAIAAGEPIEGYYTSGWTWITPSQVLDGIASRKFEPGQLRVRPKTTTKEIPNIPAACNASGDCTGIFWAKKEDKSTPYIPTKTELPYAYILREILDGKQHQSPNFHGWYDVEPSNIFYDISQDKFNPELYRVKPEIININGHEVPVPVREPLPIGTKYYFPAFNSASCCMEYRWNDDEMDMIMIETGVVHLTEEAAKKHFDALFSFTKEQK